MPRQYLDFLVMDAGGLPAVLAVGDLSGAEVLEILGSRADIRQRQVLDIGGERIGDRTLHCVSTRARTRSFDSGVAGIIDHIGVVAVTTGHGVFTSAAIDMIVAAPALNVVVAIESGEIVACRIARDVVCAGAAFDIFDAGQRIEAGRHGNRNSARANVEVDHRTARTGIDHVDGVVAVAAIDAVVAHIGNERVVAGRPADLVRAPEIDLVSAGLVAQRRTSTLNVISGDTRIVLRPRKGVPEVEHPDGAGSSARILELISGHIDLRAADLAVEGDCNRSRRARLEDIVGDGDIPVRIARTVEPHAVVGDVRVRETAFERPEMDVIDDDVVGVVGDVQPKALHGRRGPLPSMLRIELITVTVLPGEPTPIASQVPPLTKPAPGSVS